MVPLDVLLEEKPYGTTLLDLVTGLQKYATTDDEVVAVVGYLVDSGRVVLTGIFAGQHLEESPGSLLKNTEAPVDELVVNGGSSDKSACGPAHAEPIQSRVGSPTG